MYRLRLARLSKDRLSRRARKFLREAQKHVASLNKKKVFERIYREGAWGVGEQRHAEPYSGSGSRNPVIVAAYTESVKTFLGAFPRKQNLVDLGCGDFNIGAQIAPYAEKYIACDLVEHVIQHNRVNNRVENVAFMTLDITRNALPPGDIGFVRQVLQHLSNKEISRFCKNIKGVYRFLIVTEHLPAKEGFLPNLNIQTGGGTRLYLESGVVLTKPPFSLAVRSEKVICRVEEDEGYITTTVYELA